MATKKILGAVLVSFAMAGVFGGSALADAPKAEPKKDAAPAAKAEEKKPAEAKKAEAKDAKPASKAAPKAEEKKDAKPAEAPKAK